MKGREGKRKRKAQGRREEKEKTKKKRFGFGEVAEFRGKCEIYRNGRIGCALFNL